LIAGSSCAHLVLQCSNGEVCDERSRDATGAGKSASSVAGQDAGAKLAPLFAGDPLGSSRRHHLGTLPALRLDARMMARALPSWRSPELDEISIRSLIAEQLAVDVSMVRDGALFQQDLGADSLDLIELTMLLEDRLGVQIGDDESEQCLTVGEAMHLLRRKLAGASLPAAVYGIQVAG
jgi:acyl carrier protein